MMDALSGLIQDAEPGRAAHSDQGVRQLLPVDQHRGRPAADSRLAPARDERRARRIAGSRHCASCTRRASTRRPCARFWSGCGCGSCSPRTLRRRSAKKSWSSSGISPRCSPSGIDAGLLDREQRAVDASLMEEIEELWQTRPTRAVRATIVGRGRFRRVLPDHGHHGRGSRRYTTNCVFLLERHYPGRGLVGPAAGAAPHASWIGGDRDGNPNVTADVTLEVLRTQRNAHSRSLPERDRLPARSSDPVPGRGRRLGGAAGYHSGVANRPDLQERFPGEPYRQYLTLI